MWSPCEDYPELKAPSKEFVKIEAVGGTQYLSLLAYSRLVEAAITENIHEKIVPPTLKLHTQSLLCWMGYSAQGTHLATRPSPAELPFVSWSDTNKFFIQASLLQLFNYVHSSVLGA